MISSRAAEHRLDEPHQVIPQHGCIPAEPASVSPGKFILAPVDDGGHFPHYSFSARDFKSLCRLSGATFLVIGKETMKYHNRISSMTEPDAENGSLQAIATGV
jgi:hypothetical protein